MPEEVRHWAVRVVVYSPVGARYTAVLEFYDKGTLMTLTEIDNKAELVQDYDA